MRFGTATTHFLRSGPMQVEVICWIWLDLGSPGPVCEEAFRPQQPARQHGRRAQRRCSPHITPPRAGPEKQAQASPTPRLVLHILCSPSRSPSRSRSRSRSSSSSSSPARLGPSWDPCHRRSSRPQRRRRRHHRRRRRCAMCLACGALRVRSRTSTSVSCASAARAAVGPMLRGELMASWSLISVGHSLSLSSKLPVACVAKAIAAAAASSCSCPCH